MPKIKLTEKKKLFIIALYREFLTTDLKQVAAKYPQIEFVVEKKSGHPLVSGEYVNGHKKTICVRNSTPQEIIKKIQTVRESSGKPLQKYKYPVRSLNSSVRGVWSPVHAQKEHRFKI